MEYQKLIAKTKHVAVEMPIVYMKRKNIDAKTKGVEEEVPIALSMER